MAKAGHLRDIATIYDGLKATESNLKTAALYAADRSGILSSADLADYLMSATERTHETNQNYTFHLAAIELASKRTDDPTKELLLKPLIELLDTNSATTKKTAAGTTIKPHSSTLKTEPTALLAEAAAFCLGELLGSTGEPEHHQNAIAALSVQARHSTDPLCRESAIAALGAINAGLEVILAAANNEILNIKRRAVIALAPFQGPEVTATLKKCCQSQDRQIRQIAQDLLKIDQNPQP